MKTSLELLIIVLAVVSGQLDFPSTICVVWSSMHCDGGDKALTSTQVRLNYNYSTAGGLTQNIEGQRISKECGAKAVYQLSYPMDEEVNENNSAIKTASYLFEQLEHGGGLCNCLNIFFDENCTNSERNFSLCFGFANSPRRKEVKWNSSSNNFYYPTASQNTKELPLQLMCNDSVPYIEVSFLAVFNVTHPCNEINNIYNGIEFAIRLSSMPEEWIPLKYLYYFSNSVYTVPRIIITIRGYDLMVSSINKNSHIISIRLCDLNTTDFVQFRWLQSGTENRDNMWILDKIEVRFNGSTLLSDSFDSGIINSEIWPDNHVRNVDAYNSKKCGHRNGLYFGDVGSGSRALLTNSLNLSSLSHHIEDFGQDNKPMCLANINSTTVSTVQTVSSDILSSSLFFSSSQQLQSSMSQHALNTSSIDGVLSTSNSEIPSTSYKNIFSTSNQAPSSKIHTPLINSTEMSPTSTYVSIGEQSTNFFNYNSSITSATMLDASLIIPTKIVETSSIQKTDEEFIIDEEQNLLTKIKSNEDLLKIYTNKNPEKSVELLKNVTSTTDLLLSAFLLGHITDDLVGTNFSKTVLKNIVDIGNRILHSEQPNSSKSGRSAGTTVLTTLNNLQFNYLPENFTSSTPRIVLQNSLVSLTRDNEQITVINVTTDDKSYESQTSLSIPGELLQEFDGDDELPIRIVSGVFKNVSHLFSNGLENGSKLGPDIVASALACGDEGCPTSNISLKSSFVNVKFEHSTELQEMLQQNNMEISCVFLDILQNSILENATLSIGHWSTRGCTRNTSLSSTSRTVCDCNHLTHFAILLSPKPPVFSQPVKLSLRVIGYVGVLVSLIAMATTVFTFVALKSLRSMRNYIHINLCINLSIAQIIFVVGVDKTEPSNGDVPIHCQVIAVLLHYFFLVSFMWMLMEGVILYVALVKVFIKRKRWYIFAFTLTSYGLPLLYMGLLTLPLGFTRKSYGYETACFLNPSTGFVWAIIAPFIVIFLANIGFFIMAARIMWHHQSKQTDKKKLENIKSWLKSAISLVVIMSLTWIMGVFVFEVDKLAPLAYIYTIMVAFQGLFIFLIFVLFSKAVREAYVKYWKVKVSESDFLSKYFGEQVNSSAKSLTSKNETLKSSNTSSKTTSVEINTSTMEKEGFPDRELSIQNNYIEMFKTETVHKMD